jgi:multicomponent Na+:H+ antiporter subunit C
MASILYSREEKYSMDLGNLLENYIEVVAILLFGTGFTLLLFNKNLIKKIMGLNIMDTGIYLFLASMGYIQGLKAPVWDGVSTNPADYINPIPAGLVLTGIVVSVSVTAFLLALTIRIYYQYHTN